MSRRGSRYGGKWKWGSTAPLALAAAENSSRGIAGCNLRSAHRSRYRDAGNLVRGRARHRDNPKPQPYPYPYPYRYPYPYPYP